MNRVPSGGNEGAKRWFVIERLMIAARCCGASQRLIDEATDWAKEREAFGAPIADYQAVQFMLADSLTELLAARLLTYHAAEAFDSEPDEKVVHGKVAMAKLYASEAAGRIADRAVQIFGGRGYMTECRRAALPRAQGRPDLGGTSEIQRLIVARGLIKRGRQAYDSQIVATDVRQEIGEALDAGLTLPASWYGADPAIHRLELERIFARAWQYVARTEQLAEPGSFVATRAGHVPVVVVRDLEGELRGYVNVCRHRGHLVAQGSGKRASLQCPYHAWTYGLDGCLRAAPRSRARAGLRLRRLLAAPGLGRVWGRSCSRTRTRRPRRSPRRSGESRSTWPRAASTSTGFASASASSGRTRRTGRSGSRTTSSATTARLRTRASRKLIDVDPDQYLLQAEGLVASQFGPLRDGKPGFDYPQGEVKRAQYHLLWPNLTINVDPGPPNLSLDTSIPVGPHEVEGVSDYFFGEDVTDAEAREIMAFGSQVAAEDMALVESVQKGLDSGMVPYGRLLTTSEHLIQHFQRLVYESLALILDRRERRVLVEHLVRVLYERVPEDELLDAELLRGVDLRPNLFEAVLVAEREVLQPGTSRAPVPCTCFWKSASEASTMS